MYVDHVEKDDINQMKEMDRNTRMVHISDILDDALSKGIVLSEAVMEILTDLILHEELSDRSTNKSRLSDYPVYSKHQIKRQQQKSAPAVLLETMGTDGKDYRPPIRKKRAAQTELLRDKHTHARNAARRERYNAWTKPGDVHVYYIEVNQFNRL